jgi:hypothetical protein
MQPYDYTTIVVNHGTQYHYSMHMYKLIKGIGQLKKRFPILTGDGIRFPNLVKCAKLIQVLVGIHNFILVHSNNEDDADSLPSYLRDDQIVEPVDQEPEDAEAVVEYVNGRRRLVPTNELLLEEFF